MAIGLFYYTSVVLYYGFFWGMTFGHGFFFFQSLTIDDCWATQHHHNTVAYPADGMATHEHNVSANFRCVNMFGLIFFLGMTLTMMYAHCRAACEDYYDPSDLIALWLFFLFVVWCCYFLTLMIMRLRLAGRVCSGDYLANPRLFRADDPSPYIHDNGNFLWYAMIGQAGFMLAMMSGAASLAN